VISYYNPSNLDDTIVSTAVQIISHISFINGPPLTQIYLYILRIKNKKLVIIDQNKKEGGN
jgi:hypothetical protein